MCSCLLDCCLMLCLFVFFGGGTAVLSMCYYLFVCLFVVLFVVLRFEFIFHAMFAFCFCV